MQSGKHEAREYQVKIAEVASKSNTLVVLPTGLGKTLIAAMVAKRRLEEYPDSKVMVLAPTRPLVMQHLATFKEAAGLPQSAFASLTGSVDPGEREVLWLKSRMVFATPQTVYNDAKSGRISLSDVVLAVFDEAHRSVKDYTYTKLAQAYKDNATHPLILGLTASPGASRERVEEIKRSLFIDRVEARTEDSPDVEPYVEATAMQVVKVRVPDEYYELLLLLREIFNARVRKLTTGGFLRGGRASKRALLEARSTISARLRAAQASGGPKGYIYGAIMNQAQAVVILHALEVAETQGAQTLVRYLENVRGRADKGKAVSALLKEPDWIRVEDEAAKVVGVEYPKIAEVRKIVGEQFARKPDSRAIVFTQYRDTIEAIVRSLAASGLDARRFVGQSDRAGNEGMDQETQRASLEAFRSGEFRVLVSSSIGEEGLDVPDVDLVVFYEAVPSEIRFIQRRGRTGRTAAGRVVILLAEGTVDEPYYYSTTLKQGRMRELVQEEQKPARKRKLKDPTLLDFFGGATDAPARRT